MLAKKNLVAVTSVISMLLSLGGLAWACTRQANTSLMPQAGAAGTFLTITGQSFDNTIVSSPPAPTPVEIHWNSIDGPVLGSASGPDFAISVKVPQEAAPGVSYVIALQRDPLGTIVQKITRSFLVKASDSAPTTASNATASSDALWQGFEETRFGESVSAAVEPAAGSRSGLRAMGLAMVGLAFASGLLGAGALLRRRTTSR